jgi:O-antigen ligase
LYTEGDTLARRKTADAAPTSGWDRLRLGAFLAMLFLVFLGGGASRADVLSLIYLRPAAVLSIVALLLIPGPFDLARVRVPLLLLAGLALWMVTQLVPLPPGIWTQLPGHSRFAEAAAAAGLPQPWRPISISPDLTLNSLVSLSVPAAVLVAMAKLRPSEADRSVLLFLVIACVASAVLGIAQISGGTNSGLYLYRVTNDGLPVGFFANRNHQAALLACAFPMLAAWAASPADGARGNVARRWLAGVVGALLIPLIVVTGSRTGVLLAGLGLAAAFLIFWTTRPSHARAPSRVAIALMFAPWVIGLGLLLLSLVLSRATAVQRFFELSLSDERRVQDLDLFIAIARDFLPFGSGFGTFDPLFRIYEPYQELRFQYLNHAHNDFMELLITAGVPGILILLGFLYWWLKRSLALRSVAIGRSGGTLRLVASAVILILLVASLFDYPLRTPIMMALFAIAAVWIGPDAAETKASHKPA